MCSVGICFEALIRLPDAELIQALTLLSITFSWNKKKVNPDKIIFPNSWPPQVRRKEWGLEIQLTRGAWTSNMMQFRTLNLPTAVIALQNVVQGNHVANLKFLNDFEITVIRNWNSIFNLGSFEIPIHFDWNYFVLHKLKCGRFVRCRNRQQSRYMHFSYQNLFFLIGSSHDLESIWGFNKALNKCTNNPEWLFWLRETSEYSKNIFETRFLKALAWNWVRIRLLAFMANFWSSNTKSLISYA